MALKTMISVSIATVMMIVNTSNAQRQVMTQIGTYVKKYGMTGTNTMMSKIIVKEHITVVDHIIIGMTIIIQVKAVIMKVVQVLKIQMYESLLNIIDTNTDMK